MRNNAKRVLSVVLCVLMTVSMLTAIVLPAAAETAPVADAYEKVTTIEGTNKPTANVFFFDVAWENAPAAQGEEFNYTYVGNGKTYTLTWGVNAFTTMVEFAAQAKAYSEAWVANQSMSRDFVAVFAPGDYKGLGGDDASAAVTLSSLAGNAVPTVDQLLNVYMLGAKAGENPVNDARSTKEEVKAIQKGRGNDIATETVLTDTFNFLRSSNTVIDGFAGKGDACLLAKGGNLYVNILIKNYYVADLVAPYGNTAFNGYDGGGYAATNPDAMWEFQNCYINYNEKAALTGFANGQGNNGYEDISSNKIVFNNCFFSQPNFASGHKFFFIPNTLTRAKEAEAFYGEYTTNPAIIFNNCTAADWAAGYFLYFPNENSRFTCYAEGKIKFDFTNNVFYDTVGTKTTAGSTIYFRYPGSRTDKSVVPSVKPTITGNKFFVTKEIAETLTTGERSFIEYGNEANAKHSTVIKENLFCFPNGDNSALSNFWPYRYASGNDNNAYVDVSANLFVDLDGNVLPNWNPRYRGTGHKVFTDIYASAAMKGGVREIMSVRDIKGGAVLYNYIQPDAWAATTNSAQVDGATEGHNRYGDDFLGALTVLLERGKEYTINNDLFTFSGEGVVVDGLYEDQNGKGEKIATLTQDMLANGKIYYLRVSYTETAGGMTTTARVVYAVNTPSTYVVIAPEDSSYLAEKSYTFNGVTYTEGTKSNDGVTSYFFNQLTGTAIAKIPVPMGQNNQGSYYPGSTNRASLYVMNGMILLTPGVHSTWFQGGTRLLAIVGPQFAKSPYDAEANAAGNIAAGRSVDPTTEAIFPTAFNNNNLYITTHSSIHGVVIANTAHGAINYNIYAPDTLAYVRKTETLLIKNCIFNAAFSYGLVRTTITNDTWMLDMYVQDSVYYGANLEKDSVTPLFNVPTMRSVIKNFAVLSKNCFAPGSLLKEQVAPNASWTMKNTLDHTATGIIYKPANHTEKDEMIVDEEPSCYKEGKGHYLCVCGETTTRSDVAIPATEEHSFATEWTKDETGHYYACTNVGCGAKDQFEEHTESNVIVDKEADCGNAGKGHIDCTVCGYAIDEDVEIAATGDHNYGGWSQVLAPDYGVPGKKERTCRVCGDVDEEEIPELYSAASIDEIFYQTLEEAFAAAEEGDTIVLRADFEGGFASLIIDENITFDLNGHSIKAGYVVAFKGAAIIDTKGKGKLIIAKNKVALDTANKYYLPVYDADGYVFTTVTMRGMWLPEAEIATYAFSPIFDEIIHDALAAGAENSATKVVVRLSWVGATYDAVQDYVYLDTAVADVMESYGKTVQNDYDLAFLAAMDKTPDEDVSGLFVSAVIVSDTGVEIAGASAAFPVA